MSMNKKTPKSSTRKIWIDLDNSPHVPFFFPIIRELERRGFKIMLTARDCFQTCGLAEMYNLKHKKIGRHYGKSKLLKITGTIYRTIQLMPVAMKETLSLAVSHGSRAQLLACWLLKIPNIVIFDYEYAKGLGLIKPTWRMAPEIICSNFKYSDYLLKYPGIKEDVYVPEFKPDPEVLTQLGLAIDDFIVTIRPPATEAHYHNPESEILFKAVVDYLGSQKDIDIRMVILPRNEKKQTDFIKSTWREWYNSRKIIIPEHVVNGLDLMWYSDLVVSGGGTMNREAAALGVPVYSIFRGKIGAVDQYLWKEGRLTLLKTKEDVRKMINLTRRDKAKKLFGRNKKSLIVIVEHIIAIVENLHNKVV